MLGKLTGWEDTIVALATPPGIGAIGIIRISGPDSWPIVDRLFPSKDLRDQASHTLLVGLLKEGEETLDEVVLSLFKGPRSYTGEDVIEISCHGSPYILERVIKACVNQGARLARAGEFTQRAFLNGKLDLTQAEAVADLIASQSSAAAHAALHTMRGGFSRALRDLREQLLSFSALIELELDFSQEDVEFADRTRLYAFIVDAEKMTDRLLQSFRLGNVIRNGVQVAIVGKPNAGKSTLLNTLLNENRAIVSEIAGTTRDTIEEVLNIDGILFRLIDTAGIRHHTTDLVESIGVEKSLEKISQADIVVYLFDAADPAVEVEEKRLEWEGRSGVGSSAGAGAGAGVAGRGANSGAAGAGAGTAAGLGSAAGVGSAGHGAASQGGMSAGPSSGVAGMETGASDRGPGGASSVASGGNEGAAPAAPKRNGGAYGSKFLWVANKVDATGEDDARQKFRHLPEAIFISARNHWHIDVLKQRLVDRVLQGQTQTEGTMVTNARHYHALQQIAISLATIHKGLDEHLPGDLLALDIRHCLHYLGEITGAEITSEDQLDYIFSKFCIGK